MESLSERLVNKSIEAFLMGMEIYNKPTIKYRVEGFSFFICNAWELMLKSFLIKREGENSIYFQDNPDRTISLDNAIQLVFTNANDPMRKNLERIIHLRNISTHFITEDYEQLYAPLFQACVINYVEKMKEFHDEDISKYISQNFLTLSVRIDTLNDLEIRGKYSSVMAERIIRERNELLGESEEQNSSFSIPVETRFYITKNKEQADLLLGIDNSTDSKATILREIKNPNNIYPLTLNMLIKIVNKRLKADSIRLIKIKNGESNPGIFTTNDFQLFDKFYSIKENPLFTFHYDIGNRYGYSHKTTEYIFEEIKKDPENIIQNLKKNIKSK